MHAKHTILICLQVLTLPTATQGAEENGLTRQEAIRIALEVNPEVIAAQKEWEGAKARALRAGAFPSPALELEYEELPGVTSLGDFGERSFGVAQSVEFPLKWWRRRRAAQQTAHAVHQSVSEATRQEIILRVKSAYDRVLFNEERLEYNRENFQLIRSFLEKARLRRQAGDVASLDVIRAEVETGRAANRLTRIESDLDDARATVNALLGRDIRVPFELADNLDYRPSSSRLVDLRELALSRRPEIRGADSALASARSQRGLARTALLPDVNVGVFRQTIAGPTGEEGFWRVGFGLELPLWGAVRQRAELAEAKAAAAQAEAERTGLRLRVLLEVERSLLRLMNAEEQVQLFQEQITIAAERAFEVADRSYREGKSTYLDVLEAQRALVEVREEFASALFSHRTGLAELEWATGGRLPE